MAASDPSARHEGRGRTDFDSVRSLERRLGVLESSAPEALSAFYEPRLSGFSVRPGGAKRLSVASTLFSLQALFSATDCAIFDDVADLNMRSAPPPAARGAAAGPSGDRIPVREVTRALLLSDWREDDLFQVPLILHTVLGVDPGRELLGPEAMDDEIADGIRHLISAVLSHRPMRRFGQKQRYSDYIIYQCAKAMAALYESTPITHSGRPADEEAGEETAEGSGGGDVGIGGLPRRALPEGASGQILLALERCAEVGHNELCRQLAYRSASDRTSFDAVRLAYSLLTYLTATNALSVGGGREEGAAAAAVAAAARGGRGPSSSSSSSPPGGGGSVSPPNRRLVRAALGAYFDEQRSDGMWDQGQPIFKSFRRTGRNVGNAYVFATDTVASLLGALPAEDFRPHVGALGRTAGWMEDHVTVDVIADYCDPDTGRCYGRLVRGWISPHLTSNSGPESWSTAQTLTCASRMRRAVRELMHGDVLSEFGGAYAGDSGPNPAAWDRLLDTDLGDPSSAGGCRTLKGVLDDRVIRPFARPVDSVGRKCGPTFGAAYSGILFGPPGTAKTTICEALAQRMGWDFLVVDTAAFLADGLSNVASRIRYVFDRLQALENCVILFDEIEEFCLDREREGIGMESRMLTTAMLTAINDLRRAKRSIFFIATNRLRAFDAAITRPGRFDMQLFVGTPNLEARCTQFRDRLAAVPVDDHAKAAAEAAFRSFLEGVWSEDAMFMNYLEGLQFASACADVVASGSALADETMAGLLRSQAAVMTVRGAVREEYIASMGLSRF